MGNSKPSLDVENSIRICLKRAIEECTSFKSSNDEMRINRLEKCSIEDIVEDDAVKGLWHFVGLADAIEENQNGYVSHAQNQIEGDFEIQIKLKEPMVIKLR